MSTNPISNTTQEVFDKIAESWYNYRHRTIFQKELETMAEKWQKGWLLNAGCGHGPDFIPFAKGFELYGIDISARMIELAGKYASKYGFNAMLKQADARKIPYPDGFFDFAIAVASLHHIEGEAERLKALEELKRVLSPAAKHFSPSGTSGSPSSGLSPKIPRFHGKLRKERFTVTITCSLSARRKNWRVKPVLRSLSRSRKTVISSPLKLFLVTFVCW
jgi:ubiquinone/menaquinone biosynthesis C-methylase UbiE